jgi:type I restriction enzyme S subunit
LFWLKREEKTLAQKGNGSTFGAINRKDLEDFLIPLPTLSEQKRIAGILNERMAAVDKARAAAEAELKAAKALPKAYLHQVFPEEGLPIPPGWGWAKMGEICEIQLGKMLSPKSKLGIDSFPYLRNANVQWNRVNTADVACMDFCKTEQEKFRLEAGDLLICEGGEPGRSAIWDGRIDPCFYQKSLHRLRPIKNLVDPQFALFRMWIGVLRGEFISANAKTTIAHLPAIRLESLVIPLPSILEQTRIVVILNEQMSYAKQLESTIEKQLGEINALPQALLKQAFDGEL